MESLLPHRSSCLLALLSLGLGCSVAEPTVEEEVSSCIEDHPREEFPLAAPWDEQAAASQQTCLALWGEDCKQRDYLSAEAAACIAQAHGLPEGEPLPGGEPAWVIHVDYHADDGVPSWHLHVIEFSDTAREHWRGISLNAVTGDVLHEAHWVGSEDGADTGSDDFWEDDDDNNGNDDD